ncbi:MAG: polysaccharide biosynthesis C-terminal domain-containing protein, partial [Patescibacteria group bacterium]
LLHPFLETASQDPAVESMDPWVLPHTMNNNSIWVIQNYDTTNKLTYAFQFLPMAFIAALYPTFSHLIALHDRDGLLRVFDRSMWYVSLIGVPIIFGVFSVADLIVPLIYGGDYAASILPLQILIFALLFIFLDFPIGSLLNADDRQMTKTIIMGQTMVINLVANLILIPRFGVAGASVATMASFIWLLGASFVAMQKTVPYRLRRLLVTVGPILFSGIVMAAVVFLTKPFLGLAVIPVGGIVYIAGLFLLGSLSRHDLRAFRHELRST